MRVRSRWNDKGKERTAEEIASALAFIAWRIAGNAVLNLENENYQTDTQAQRLDVIAEFLALLVHTTDRLSYGRLDEDERQRCISAFGVKLANTMQDNRVDAQGPGDYRQAFIDLLNARMDDYAEFPYPDDAPGFAVGRYLGDRVTAVMGPRDSRWLTTQVMDIELPDAMTTLRKALRDLLPATAAG